MRRSMRRLKNAMARPATAMPIVLALTAKPMAAGVTPYALASDGRIACVAKRSTTVRNAVSPMMSERRSAALIRGCVVEALPAPIMMGPWKIHCEKCGAPDDSAGAPPLGGRNRPAVYIMWSSIFAATGNRSTEISTAVALPVFFHQCDVPFFSGAMSPALCTIGTAQLLAYSTTSPDTM